ncbi:hypothetical protein OG520_39655 (plasmid) [Streptomyces sp. NBC_00984]|uniref:hypothetical protein n=1 Tax=Streptomyces sp. NBC_00984 TaxID=2903700 RepID=UPI002F907F6D|nr:hypothetical protein OG520_39655 [Streptomyces sp. NBC_00984]
MTAIDALLARALLLEEPARPRDVVRPSTEAAPGALSEEASRRQDTLAVVAGRDLQALCEILVSRTPTSDLQVFVTEQIPEPAGARVLGCVLQLANAAEGARAWWQCAAGAGDAAAYCLYLHHRALGATKAAECWYQQTGLDIPPGSEHSQERGDTAGPVPMLTSGTSTPTLLRVFRNLTGRTSRPRTEAVNALMHYLPTAVAIGYVNDEPDIDLPLPGPGFAEQIGVLLAAAGSTAAPARQGRRPKPPLRSRREREHGRAWEETGQAVRG